MRWILPFLFLVGAAAQQQPGVRFEEYAPRVLDRWQKNTGVLIEPAAQRRILEDISRRRASVRKWQRVPADSVEEQALLTELQRHYCFNLRDKQAVRPNAAAGFLMNVQLTGATRITESDVKATTFQALVDWLMSTFGPREVGYLEIKSPQPGAPIYFGRDGKPSGITARSFVMGVGMYQVRIAPGGVPACSQRVEIRPRERSNVACPPQPAG